VHINPSDDEANRNNIISHGKMLARKEEVRKTGGVAWSGVAQRRHKLTDDTAITESTEINLL